jgi:hypothetical protein
MKLQKQMLSKFFRKKKTPVPASSASGELALKLLHAIDHTHEKEYSCEETLELLDQFAEMVARGEDASQVLPLVKEHLEICSDCREEVEALLRILEESPIQEE